MTACDCCGCVAIVEAVRRRYEAAYTGRRMSVAAIQRVEAIDEILRSLRAVRSACQKSFDKPEEAR